MTPEEQIEQLRKEYNAAVANGLLLRAKHLSKRMSAIAHDNGIVVEDCLCARCRAATFGKTHW